MKTLLLLLLVCVGATANAQPASPTFVAKQTLLKNVFDKKHYRPRVWNDSSSSLLFNKWLKELDEEKILFTKQDVLALGKHRFSLDEELKTGRADFFYNSLKLLRKRLQKADSIMRAFLEKPVDFTVAETTQSNFADYPESEKDAPLRLRQYLKYEILDAITNKMIARGDSLTGVIPADFTALEKAARAKILLQTAGQLSGMPASEPEFYADYEDSWLNAIAWAYDPHSGYMSMSDKESYLAEANSQVFTAGLGFEEGEKGEKVISHLEPGSSAFQSGQIHKGDVILSVTVGGVTRVAEELSAGQLAALLETTEKTVTVKIKTAAGEIKTVKLSQEKIDDEDNLVKSYVIRGVKNFGYINLPGFYSREEEGQKQMKFQGCANDVSKEIIKLRKDSIAGLILDLRANGGGSMWEAMQLAGIFIDAGPVAVYKESDGKTQMLKDPNRGTIYDGPLLVLINAASASASEFLSAALQDYNRALIVGGPSYGKGTAQDLLPMDTATVPRGKNYSDFVKITDGKFYRVNGGTVQWRGVEPDISYPDVYENAFEKEREIASALLPDSSKPGNFKADPPLPIAALRAKSMARTAGNPYFTFLKSFSFKAASEKPVPLSWKAYVQFVAKTRELAEVAKGEWKKSIETVTTVNNALDRELLNNRAPEAVSANSDILRTIGRTPEVIEAVRILEDWVK